MSKISKPNKFIVFTIVPNEKYEIDTKYQITDEDVDYYYLKENKIDKHKENEEYTVGEIIRPRT